LRSHIRAIALIVIFIDLLFCQDHIHWGSLNNPLNGLTVSWHSDGLSDQIKWGYTTSYEEGTFSGIRRTDYSGYLYDYSFPTVNSSSTIHYCIQSDGVWTSDKTFQTSRDISSTSFSFIAGGDSRSNMDDWETSANQIATESTDFHLFLGDHVYSGTSTADWNMWYNSGNIFLSTNLIYHTGGNHEYGSIYLNQFVMPGNEKWYSFEFGNALFICLLSQVDYAAQHDWLVNELETTNKKWKIVFFHKPFFAVGGHADDMNAYRDTWWKAFDDNGVDVVLGGHVHYYLRSKPINLNVSGASAVAQYGDWAGQGRLQIIAGSYGAPLYAVGSDWFVEENLSTMNYTKFDINDNTLVMNAYNMSGALIDNVTINKEAEVSLPVILSFFSISQVHNTIELNWICESEIENMGFTIERRSVGEYGWLPLDSYLSNPHLEGQGSTTQGTPYEFIDRDVMIGETYEYRLRSVDYSGKINQLKSVSVTVVGRDQTQQPYSATISNPFPNPFNPATTISYYLPEQSTVKLTVFDILGQEVMMLQDDVRSPGNYKVQWNGTDQTGTPVSQGVYFCRFVAGVYTKTIKMVYLG
jgi:hypothetical protein